MKEWDKDFSEHVSVCQLYEKKKPFCISLVLGSNATLRTGSIARGMDMSIEHDRHKIFIREDLIREKKIFCEIIS